MTGPLLLDTHALIWALTAPARLRSVVRDALADPSVLVFVSAASTWEIAIKAGLGKLPPPLDDLPGVLGGLGFRELPVTVADSLAVQALPHSTAIPSTGFSWRRRAATGSRSSRPMRGSPGTTL